LKIEKNIWAIDEGGAGSHGGGGGKEECLATADEVDEEEVKAAMDQICSG
jgi:hypothetical protein